MKILITILGVLLLSGCEPTPMGKAKQDQACQDKGGVYNYTSWNGPMTQCMNGEFIDWSKLILTEEFYPEKGE